MLRKTITGLLTASLILAPCSVSGNAITASAASKPTATKSLTLTVGEEGHIKVKGANIKSYKFQIVNKKIVSVSKKGVVKAKKKGKCNVKITVKYRKTKKAKKLFTKKLICHVTVKEAKKPKNTKKPKTTKAPKATVTPQTTKKPEITATPKPTAAVQVSESPTTTPEVTVMPEPTATSEVTETPEPTMTPQPTAAPTPVATQAPTAVPVVTAAPETPVVTTAPTPEPTTITNAAVINIKNSSWETVCTNLATPISFRPGDKVYVSISAEDANGNALTDFSAQIIFSSGKDAEIWGNRINVCAGQNPSYADEWRWVWPNSSVELFNTLTDATTANGIVLQVSNPSSALSNTDMITVTINTIKIEIPPQKNEEDVAALTRIIEEQNASGAHVSTDLDSTQYEWGENGRLERIYWEDCGLSGELSLSDLPALTLINCSKNQLTSVDVSQNAALSHLSCYENKLTSLNVQNNSALGLLMCCDNQLDELDVTKNPYLTILNCMNNRLTTLDISQNPNLTYFYCGTNMLTSIDVSKQPKLLEFNCSDNKITDLDISNNPGLSIVRCARNQITSIDATHNPALIVLDCDQGVSVTGFTKKKNEKDVAALNKIIEEQTASGATISADLDSEQYTWDDYGRVVQINWHDCNLSGNISFSGLDKLIILDCSCSQLTGVDASENTSLSWLNCSENQLTDLDISKNVQLNTLYCSDNQLTNLDISKNVQLISLYCSNNQLTNIDVSKNIQLCSLSCSNNQLADLDISYNTKLINLSCTSNNLTELDITAHPDLVALDCDESVTVKTNPKNTQEVTALNQIIEQQNKAGAAMPENLDDSAYVWAPNGRLREIQWNSLGLSGEISLSEFTYLDRIFCDDNALSGLNVSHNTDLTCLSCAKNQLKNLDVSQNLKLYTLICTDNQLTKLDVQNCIILSNGAGLLQCDPDVEVTR